MDITSLIIGKQKRVNVYLDGKFALSLDAETAVREGLQVGQKLTAEQIAALSDSDQQQRCFDAAVRYLSYRPRSESEVRTRLKKHGFAVESINKTMNRLKEQGLVDDEAFAKFWKENRQTFNPRSQMLTRLELKQKGVEVAILNGLDNEPDEESAYQAGLSRLRSLPLSDYQVFRRRLGEFLRRRGFSYQTTSHTVERIWQEYGISPDNSSLSGLAPSTK